MKCNLKRCNPKRFGETIEVLFTYQALIRGLAVCKPIGDSEAYDFVVSYRGHYARVQVRSRRTQNKDRFNIPAGHAGQRFVEGEYDVLAAFIPAFNTWYIIPGSALKGVKQVRLYPNVTNSRGRFERYREAWHLLTALVPTPEAVLSK